MRELRIPAMALLALVTMTARAADAPPVPGAGAAPVLTLQVEPLTKQAFKAFGELVEVPEGMKPTVENAILSYWGGLAKARFHGPAAGKRPTPMAMYWDCCTAFG